MPYVFSCGVGSGVVNDVSSHRFLCGLYYLYDFMVLLFPFIVNVFVQIKIFLSIVFIKIIFHIKGLLIMVHTVAHKNCA